LIINCNNIEVSNPQQIIHYGKWRKSHFHKLRISFLLEGFPIKICLAYELTVTFYSDLQTFFSYSLREMFGQLVFLCLPQNVKIDLFYFTTSKLLYLQCCIKIIYSFVIFLWNYKSCVYYRSKISSNIYCPLEVHTIFIRINCQFKMHF